MSDKQGIDTPHERRPFQDHGHMDVVTLGDEDLRGLPFIERRERLEALVRDHPFAPIDLSPLIPFATWEDPADDAANIAWVRNYRKANAPFTTGGVYLNFIGDEGEERIKAAFGAEKHERLTQIKSEYDPGNVFAGNQNIRPTVPA